MESSPEDGIQDAIQAILAATSSHDEVQAALRVLEPIVAHLASCICDRRSVRTLIRREFVDSAIGLIWERLPSFDAGKGTFEAWVSTVLARRLISEFRTQLRQNRRKQPGVDLDAVVQNIGNRRTPNEVTLDTRLDWGAPFSAADLQLVGSWNVRDSLRLLAIGRLWHKVPAPVWEVWCEEVGVELPFPPSEAEADTELIEMIRIIAAAMGEPWDAFKQQWYRKRRMLGALTFIKGIRHDR